jgi:hypothetical protein
MVRANDSYVARTSPTLHRPAPVLTRLLDSYLSLGSRPPGFSTPAALCNTSKMPILGGWQANKLETACMVGHSEFPNMPMKYFGLLALCALAIATFAACGSSSNKAPLAVEDRRLTGTDVPGYAVAREFVWDDVTGVVDVGLGTTTIQASTDDVRKAVSNAGFKKGSARVFEKGATEPKDTVVVIALEFESNKGAKDVLAFSANDSELPCKESCAFAIAKVNFGRVPNARAVQRIATAESIAATADQELSRPTEVDRIVFTDGPFFYFISTVRSPDPAALENAEALASTLYTRVKGAPAPK